MADKFNSYTTFNELNTVWPPPPYSRADKARVFVAASTNNDDVWLEAVVRARNKGANANVPLAELTTCLATWWTMRVGEVFCGRYDVHLWPAEVRLIEVDRPDLVLEYHVRYNYRDVCGWYGKLDPLDRACAFVKMITADLLAADVSHEAAWVASDTK